MGIRRHLALCLPLLLAGCGGDGDEGPVDAPPALRPDARPPDAMTDRCAALCGCLADFCGEPREPCLAGCAGLGDSVRQCRLDHCGYAQTNPGYHCPHALGTVDAPGTPPECVTE